MPALAPVALRRRDDGVERRVPVGGVAAVGAGEVEDDEVQRIAALHHRGEGRRLLLAIAPDEGVVVERVGDRDHLAEASRRRRSCLGLEVAEIDLACRRRCRPSARPRRRSSSSRKSSLVASGPPDVQQLQRFEQFRQGARRGDAEALEYRRRETVSLPASEAVWETVAFCACRLADLQRRRPAFQFARAGRPAARSVSDVVETFDMQADGGDARVFEGGDGSAERPVWAWLPAVII